jgi:hypothetical protein
MMRLRNADATIGGSQIRISEDILILLVHLCAVQQTFCRNVAGTGSVLTKIISFMR